MQSVTSGGHVLEADAGSILRSITPALETSRHKADAAPVIKGYSPGLMVRPILEECYSVRDEETASVSAEVIQEVDKWMEGFDCLVIGPGLGRNQFLLDCVSGIMKHARQSNIPMVVDGLCN